MAHHFEKVQEYVYKTNSDRWLGLLWVYGDKEHEIVDLKFYTLPLLTYFHIILILIIHFIETRLQYNWHNNKNADGLVNRLASNLVILNQAHRVAWLRGQNSII